MEAVPGHTYLFRRGAVYYFRAVVPKDIQESFGKREVVFSLRTKDYAEAKRRVKLKAVEVQGWFDDHKRRQERQATAPVLKELPDETIKRLGELYYAALLDQDEDSRLKGFDEGPWPKGVILRGLDHDQINQMVSAKLDYRGTFEEKLANLDWWEKTVRNEYARGEMDSFFLSEARDVLSRDGVNLKLADDSPSLRKLARELQAATLRAMEAEKKRNEGKVIDTPVVGTGAPLPSATPKLSQAADEWVAEKTRTSWAPKTAREHRVWMDYFISVAGDRPLSDYGKADGRSFKAVLMKLPANWTKHKRLAGLGIGEAAERASRLDLTPMSDSNVNKLLRFVGSFFTWAERHYDDCPPNPLRGLTMVTKKRPRDQRDPFTIAELNAIFRAPIYTGCMSLHFYHQPGELIPRESGKYWVPLISLFTGAREGEIIQLYVDDIRQEDGVAYLDINKVGDGKSLKTAASERKIPIHPVLDELGLLDHVEVMRQAGQRRLFPDLKKGKDGYYSSPFSKWYSRFLDKVGVKRRSNAFHSYRHCFEDACRNSGIPHGVMNAFQGHAEPGMAGRYGSGYSLKVLAQEMAKLHYDGLDLSHLMSNPDVLG